MTPSPTGFDDAGGLVAEQEREVVVDAALAVVQVGVAHAAGLDRDHASPGPGSGTTIVSIETGAPLRSATTPRTCWLMVADGSAAAAGELTVRVWERRTCMNRRRLVQFASVAALALALAACGSDGTASNDTGLDRPGRIS